jgi:RNA polymerase sigma factor (sigma-70 family)
MPAVPLTDSDLLAALRNGGREEAFRALVERHLGLVFGLAMRRTGRRELAEDISQNVFAALAKRAAKLRAEPTLAGWLHRVTLLECADALRRESAHGRKLAAFAEHAAAPPGRSVWSEALPVLDECIAALPGPDRDLVLMRFFERKGYRDIAAALGKSEDAAQKQGERALQKLADLLARRGVTFSTASLAALLMAQGASAAPAGLPLTLAKGALAGISTLESKSLLLQALEFMAHSKTRTAVAVALIAAVPLVWQASAIRALQRELADARKPVAAPAPAPVKPATLAAAARPPASRASAAIVRPASLPVAEAAAPLSAPDVATAWERALTEPDPLVRARKLADLLGSLTAENAPLVAEVFQRFEKSGRNFESEQNLFLRAWGRVDGGAAVLHATKGGADLKARSKTLAALAGWATADALSTRAWLEALPDTAPREALIYGLLDGWSTVNFAAAADYAASRPRSESRNSFRELLLERSLAAGGVPAAQQWFAGIPDNEHNSLYKQHAFDEVIRAMLYRDPAAAAQWLAQQGGRAYLTAGPVTETAAKLAQTAPLEALRWLENFRAAPDGAVKEGVALVMKDWAKRDVNAAGQFLQGQSQHPQYDAMAGSFAQAVAKSNPQAALAWAQSIRDEAARTAAQNAVAKGWLRQEPDAAKAWFHSAGYTDEWVKEMTAAKDRMALSVRYQLAEANANVAKMKQFIALSDAEGAAQTELDLATALLSRTRAEQLAESVDYTVEMAGASGGAGGGSADQATLWAAKKAIRTANEPAKPRACTSPLPAAQRQNCVQCHQ